MTTSDTFRVEDERWLWVGDRRFPIAEWMANEYGTDDFAMRVRKVRLRFESKLSLSIIWGNATYSSNFDATFGDVEFTEEPTLVEVGVCNDDGLIGSPLGYQSVDDVLRVADAVSRGEVPVIVFGEE